MFLNITSDLKLNNKNSDLFFNNFIQNKTKNFKITVLHLNSPLEFVNKSNQNSFVDYLDSNLEDEWYYFLSNSFIIDVAALIDAIKANYDPEIPLIVTSSYGASCEPHIKIAETVKFLKLDSLFKFSNKPNFDLSETGFLINNKAINMIINNPFCQEVLKKEQSKHMNFSLLMCLLAKYCKIPCTHCPFIEDIGKFGRGRPVHSTLFNGDVSLITNLDINSLDYESYEYLLDKFYNKNKITYDLEKELINKSFIFGRKNLDVISDNITLDKSGKIIGSKFPNEYYWDINQEKLEFRDNNYYLTTIFDKINDRLFEGKYIHNVNCTHYLKAKE